MGNGVGDTILPDAEEDKLSDALADGSMELSLNPYDDTFCERSPRPAYATFTPAPMTPKDRVRH